MPCVLRLHRAHKTPPDASAKALEGLFVGDGWVLLGALQHRGDAEDIVLVGQ